MQQQPYAEDDSPSNRPYASSHEYDDDDDEAHEHENGYVEQHQPAAKEKRTRIRQALSCTECKRRKIKCDRSLPCSSCVKRGDQVKCRWEPKKERPKPSFASSQEVADLRATLDDTRQQLSALMSLVQSSAASATTPAGGFPLSLPRTPALAPPDIIDEERDAAFTLEDLAMGRRAGRDAVVLRPGSADAQQPIGSMTRERAPSVGSAGPAGQASSPGGFTGGAPLYCSPPSVITSHVSSTAPSSFPFPSFPSSSRTSTILRLLPSRARSDTLLHSYLTRIEWLHHPLHVPRFLSAYRAFLSAPQDAEPRWLAVYAAVLCVAAHFDGAADNQEDREEAERYYHASRAALAQAHFLASHSLEAIQAIIILGLYLHNINLTETHFLLMGLAIKMAQVMGLSRIPPEVEGSELKGSIVQRELGRRLWHSLRFQDAFSASACSYSYAIHPDQASTDVPVNVEDEELVDGVPLKPKPREVWTDMSYFIAKLRFGDITRKIVDALNTNQVVSYDFVLRTDAEYREALEEVPSFLRLDVSELDLEVLDKKPSRVWERVMASMTIHNRLMRLHRGYFTQGYQNPEFEYSTVSCVAAARAVLALMQQGRATKWPGGKWWVVLVQCWTAAIVILIDLFHTSDHNEVGQQQVQEKTLEVVLALEIFRDVQETSTVARRAVVTLERLLDEDATRRAARYAQSSRKRKHSRSLSVSSPSSSVAGASAEQPAHKRHVLDASFTAHSAGTAEAAPSASAPIVGPEFWEEVFRNELGMLGNPASPLSGLGWTDGCGVGMDIDAAAAGLVMGHAQGWPGVIGAVPSGHGVSG